MMCAWREEDHILPAIKQFEDICWGDDTLEVIVACSEKPWYGTGERDKTAEIAVAAGATVRVFPWKDEKDQKNWIMDKMQDKMWMFMFAPDMFMTKDDLRHVINFLKEEGCDDAYGVEMVTYWKDYEHQTLPAKDFNTLAIRSHHRFGWSSRIEAYRQFPKINGPIMHHLSFVRTDEEMKTKISTWSHAPSVRKGWYDSVWKNESFEQSNLGLEYEGDISKIGTAYLPDEIRRRLCR